MPYFLAAQLGHTFGSAVVVAAGTGGVTHQAGKRRVYEHGYRYIQGGVTWILSCLPF